MYRFLLLKLVGAVGFEPTTSRLSGATGHKPAALPIELRPRQTEIICRAYAVLV